MDALSPQTSTLLKGVFVKDTEGKVFLRVSSDTPTGEVKIATGVGKTNTLQNLIANSITIEDGKPALRMIFLDPPA